MKSRGQVTLFIIVGLVIVSAILVFFLWVQPTFTAERSGRLGFEGCIDDVVGEAILELEKNAGFISPEFTHAYDGEEFAYLCYANEFLDLCTVQKPLLRQHFEEQLTIRTDSGIRECYSRSIASLRSQGYDVREGRIDFTISIDFGGVRVAIEAPTTIGSQRFTKFDVVVPSPLYELLMITTSILQFETRYGDFETSSIPLLYDDYTVRKIKRGDGTTLYMLEHRTLDDVMQFASRSLAWPAGYYGG